MDVVNTWLGKFMAMAERTTPGPNGLDTYHHGCETDLDLK